MRKKPNGAVQDPPGTAQTLREVLGIKGDVRVGQVAFNLFAGGLTFVPEEGVRTEDGFLPRRALPPMQGLAPEQYDRFVIHARQIVAILNESLADALDKPVQVQGGQQG